MTGETDAQLRPLQIPQEWPGFQQEAVLIYI